MKVISKDNVGHNLFFFPEYIAIDRTAECFYVTDRYSKTDIAMTTQSEKLWQSKIMYVAGNKSHNMLMLTTEDEITGSVIVDDVSNSNKIALVLGRT